MTTTVEALRNLDERLAHAARMEIEAKQWRIKSGKWRAKYEAALDRIAELERENQFRQEAFDALMVMADEAVRQRNEALGKLARS